MSIFQWLLLYLKRYRPLQFGQHSFWSISLAKLDQFFFSLQIYDKANPNSHWKNNAPKMIVGLHRYRDYTKFHFLQLNCVLLYIIRSALTRCIQICKEKKIWSKFAKDIEQNQFYPNFNGLYLFKYRSSHWKGDIFGIRIKFWVRSSKKISKIFKIKQRGVTGSLKK